MRQDFGELNGAITKLNLGVQSLNSGTKQLNSGVEKVNAGTASLNSGLKTLSTSSEEVKTAITSIASGTTKAYDGGIALANGVKTLKTEISNGIEETKQSLKKLDGLDSYAEDPIEIKEESYGEVKEYGVSFTPLFLSIGLWVGALMCYVILYYDQEKRFKILGRYANNKMIQIALYLGIAAAQGLITAALLKLGLGFNVQNTFLYYTSSVIIAVTFMSVIQFLIINFGDIGKFLALIVLVLQLAASGGTFPVETINKGFQVLTNFLPMTYAIRLLKESLVLIDKGFAMKNILVLLAFIIVPLIITTITSYIKQKKYDTVKALLETDGNGRFTSVRFEDDSVTYTLNVETVTDDDAYKDAMNQYNYENAQYDKMVQDINVKTSLIQQEDQQLELRLKQLDTEQNALSTEIDAVSKVVKDNIEDSFKTFGG